MSTKMFANLEPSKKKRINDPLSNPTPISNNNANNNVPLPTPTTTSNANNVNNNNTSNTNNNVSNTTQPKPKASMMDLLSKPKTSMNDFMNASKPAPKKSTNMFDLLQAKPKEQSPPVIPELILIIGDAYIPSRIGSIPEEVKQVFENNRHKFSRIICTGNFGRMEEYEFLKSLLPKGKELNFHCVKSDFQETKLSFPEKIQIKSNDFKIGVINGYQIVPWGDLTSLNSLSKQLECDIMISGFTHIRGVYNFEDKYFLNPGTFTGAFSPLSNNPPPSFMILLTVSDIATLYLYEFNNSTKQFDVSKLDLIK